MVLVLCIGDLHVPHRATDLPPQFKKLLVPGKIHHTLCTGNLVTKEIYDYLRTVCSDLHIAKGEFDEDSSYPEDKILTVGDFKVVPAGSKARLGFVARQMDVDILVAGSQHEFRMLNFISLLQAERAEGRLLIDPGSATGASSVFSDQVIPSFVLMDITGRKAVLYVYELKDGEVNVTKMEHSD